MVSLINSVQIGEVHFMQVLDVGTHVRTDQYALCLLLMNRACQAGEKLAF